MEGSEVTDEAAVLPAVAELGPFFAVAQKAAGTQWLPLAHLRAPDVISDRVLAARQVLANGSNLAPELIEERACASVVFLGWAARLLSPALGSAVLSATVPAMADAYCRPGVGSPMPLALPHPTFERPVPGRGLVDVLRKVVVEETIAPLADAVGATFSVSHTVLWGNVASALAGSARMIATARPDRAGTTERIVDALLSSGPLAGKGGFRRESASRRLFTRSTCCLFYRIPGGGTCGDCVLNR